MTAKPLQLEREEFAIKMSTLINESPMPAFIKVDILKSFTNDLIVRAAKEYDEAVKMWETQERGGE